MATKVLGKVGITSAGVYNANTTYDRLTTVIGVDGNTYISKSDGIVGISPSVTAGWEEFWSLFVERGNGIASIALTSTSGVVDTYTITYDDGSTSTFTITNGSDGKSYSLVNNTLTDSDSTDCGSVDFSAVESEIADLAEDVRSKSPAVIKTVTGSVASFDDGADGVEVKDLTVDIEPVQDTSGGEPSPTNICPITGWTGVTVSKSDADTSNPETYTIDWTSEAGTVYGGTLNVTTGLLTVDRAIVTLSSWSGSVVNSGTNKVINAITGAAAGVNNVVNDKLIASNLPTVTANNQYTNGGTNITINSSSQVRISVSEFTTASEYDAWLADNPVTFVYPIATPLTYQLTPTEVTTLLGENNIWATTGDVTAEYPVSISDYVENITGDIDNLTTTDKTNLVSAINELDADTGTLSDEIAAQAIREKLFNSDLPDTTKTVTFDSDDNPTTITHVQDGTTIRTDTFVWSTNSVTETRTLASGAYITITTNLTTLETVVSDILGVA